MNSPFVRRQRLAAELRTLREDRGMTAEQLSRLLHMSRMKISKLENARVRPNVGEIMNILDCLEVEGNKRNEIIHVARGAAEKGWWTSFGDAMDSRQCLFADVESGAATIREYSQFKVPSCLQTRDYASFLIETAMPRADASCAPERALEARLHRQKQLLASGGPRYEVVIDEIVMRRRTAPPQVMIGQLRHLSEIATRHPHITLRIMPLAADFSGRPLPDAAFSVYTFPDPNDPSIVLIDTLGTEIVHIKPNDVAAYSRQYESLREVALSAAASLGLLTDLIGELRSSS
ncbi:helix-turn-helix domain-containing protein [Spirillospora sp. CA-294931]|uniref:helix-turn-helix domain-containing protein n=1 Tax=Spirillospora sp. CA-294931 TaxID=3240042 RepID=UPI003D8DEB3B